MGGESGKASTLMKNLNEPVCCTPSRNCKLILAPTGRGIPRLTVIVPLCAPPIACVGGCSNVVPKTVTWHGAVGGVPVATQVDESVIPVTVTFADVRALRSAIPPGTDNELISTMRNRRRVTGTPVLFTKRRLIDIVPFAPLVTGVRFRTRLGGAGDPMFESRKSAGIVLFRSNGLARF